MNRDWLLEQFSRQEAPPRRFNDLVEGVAGFPGDHSLNPDMPPLPHGDGRLRPAAVLVLLVDRAEGLTVLFTQRTDHLHHHPGQISFPGGRTEKEDSGPQQTALRETHEEVGVPPESVQLIGQLDDYITRTGFVVTPVVGLIEPPFVVTPDPFEVAEVFEVPLHYLLDPDNHQRHSRHVEGRERFFWAMPYQGYFIWGATAGMLRNLYHRLAILSAN